MVSQPNAKNTLFFAVDVFNRRFMNLEQLKEFKVIVFVKPGEFEIITLQAG